jgi:hypothetical protein
MRPNHLFVCDSDYGALYDTRNANWSRDRPLRPVYSGSYKTIQNTHKLRAALRYGKYTDLGGYPLYFITTDGCALSFDSVRKNLRLVTDSVRHDYQDGWGVVAVEVNWEDADLYCEHSGERIASAYAEPDSDEDLN